jgi:Arc-like DNA binding domain
MQKTVAKRAARPRGRSPVIAGRVPSSLHRKIKQAAKASGRSMSEELAFRAEQSFQWEAFELWLSAIQSQTTTLSQNLFEMAITQIKKLQTAQKLNEEALSRIVEAAVARALANREELP